VKVFYVDTFELPLPPGHRFPIAKYAFLRQRVQQARLAAPPELAIPPAASDAALLSAHDGDYLERVKSGRLTASEQRIIGFPWSPAMLERARRSVGATIAACRAALSDGIAVSLAGGTHHAFRDRGEGYCLFNDAAVAARAVQAEGLAGRVLVIDCDVHQGNGTAAIFDGDPSVFTLSVHGANNYPPRKQRSDLDIALPDGCGDLEYLDALERGLGDALAAAHADLAIYLAGVDPFVHDRLGRLGLSKHGLAARDRRVFQRCRGSRIPVAVTMAGGYGPRIEDTVDIHFSTVEEAARWCGPAR
jgi:acetoin utilization deacetylase AcuC-like enzyme